jgi:hypothetical protein
MARRAFALNSGGQITADQLLFIPEHEPALLISLTLTNHASHPLDFILSWLVRFDIQSSWWSNLPDRPDTARFHPPAAVLASDTLHSEWSASILADRTPSAHNIGPDLWACEKTASLVGTLLSDKALLRNPADLQGQGVSARLDYPLSLAPGGTDILRFVISGSTQGQSQAHLLATTLLASFGTHHEQKRKSFRALQSAATTVHSPSPDLDHTFASQTLCMDTLTLEMPSVIPLSSTPHSALRTPHSPAGIVAGLPEFPWFFGCDTYYCVSGLAVSGQHQTALDTLRLLAGYARNQRGRIPHEIVPTRDLFNPGNTVETGEFTTAVERAFRWTADRAFLEEMYPICKQGIFDYMLGECDPHSTLLPDGPGILELRTAEHGKKLDVACSLYQALNSLTYLAAVMDDPPTAERAAALADQVKEQINLHFWVPDRQEYVWRIEPDLSVRPGEPAHSYAALEMGLLDDTDTDRITLLFDKIEGPEQTGPYGLIHPGTADYYMPIQNAIVALAEFRYNRPDRGLWYLQRMADLCGYLMPGAIPEALSPTSCFLQAWSSAAYNWLLVQGIFRLNPDPTTRTVTVQPQLPTGWDHLEVRNLPIWGHTCTLRLDRLPTGIAFTPISSPDTIHFHLTPTPPRPVTFA